MKTFFTIVSMTFILFAPELRATPQENCIQLLEKLKGPTDKKAIEKVCMTAQVLDGCTSVKGVPIVHYDRTGSDSQKKKILVFSLIHGDEKEAGTMVRYWMQRLSDIEPRNDWRVVPVLNPDGVEANTRTNANRVDLNRNFPTEDWSREAEKYWKERTSSNPRRFPGSIAGGEPEVQCAMKHIIEYKPEFVVSIHTPLGVLDFDGPKVKPPQFGYLPWKSLGHFTGSLGRFLWAERNIPTLTTELRAGLPSNYKAYDDLQDILGYLAKHQLPKPIIPLSPEVVETDH